VGAALLMAMMVTTAEAGGPRWVAGTAYFNSKVLGQPLVWAGGNIFYYTDQGALSSYVSNAEAGTLVAAAAAPWTQVPTAAVTISPAGTLSEDVNGANVTSSGGVVAWPADVESTAKPLAVIYDADGTVLNALLGAGASDPSACFTNSVYSLVDNMSASANIAHAMVILNGLCATNETHVAEMQYLLTREFGRLLGLGWSQTNDNVFTQSPMPTPNDVAGWPLMHPVNVDCGEDTYSCLGANPLSLRMDDRAALGRMYPAASFATNTVNIYGTIYFATGQRMQGVNVIATHLLSGTNTPDTTMVASAVSGEMFRGNAGSVVTGTLDSSGNAMTRFGSNVATEEGKYYLAGLEVPAGQTTVSYELTLVAVNPLYTGTEAVGPETPGTPLPSGTMVTRVLKYLKAGQSYQEDFTISDSASNASSETSGTQTVPEAIPATGQWGGRLTGYGDVGWFSFIARPNRTFTLLTEALDETLSPSERKAMPVIGVWFAGDAPGAPADFATLQPFNWSVWGETMLNASTPAGDGTAGYAMTEAIADYRGDGRPDYNYTARLFYGDTVSPSNVPVSGGLIHIGGMGFESGETVLVNGQPATVLSAGPTGVLALAPAGAAGVVDVEVDDAATGASAVLSGALTYGTTAADGLIEVGAPSGTVATGLAAASPWIVEVVDGNNAPVANASVALAVTAGSATLAACGSAQCTVQATNSGMISTAVTPTASGTVTLTASLADGNTVSATFLSQAGTGLTLVPGVGNIFVEASKAMSWPVSVTAISGGTVQNGVAVTWAVSAGGTVLATSKVNSNSAGVSSYTAALPSLAAGSAAQIQACPSSGSCAVMTATAAAPAMPAIVALSGSEQSVSDNQTLQPLVLLTTDGAIPGNPIAGLPLSVTETLYSYSGSSAPSGKQPVAKVIATETVAMKSNAAATLSIQPFQQMGVPSVLHISVATSSGSQVLGTFLYELGPALAVGGSQGNPVVGRSGVPVGSSTGK
jgi:hypothetical protein